MTAPRAERAPRREPFAMLNHAVQRSAVWRDPLALKALVDLLFLAGPAGEYSTSRRYLAQRWNWSKSKVDRFLAYLASPASPQRITLDAIAEGDGSRTVIRFAPPNHPAGQQMGQFRVADTRVTPFREPPSEPPSGPNRTRCGTDEVDGPRSAKRGDQPRGSPELIAYVEALADALNTSQLSNGLIDRADYKPALAHHAKNLAAANEILRAGVTLEWAIEYVRMEAARYKPRPDSPPQIFSLAYLKGGLLRTWQQRRQLEFPPPIARGDVAVRVPPAPKPAPVVPELRERQRRSTEPVMLKGPLAALIERMEGGCVTPSP